MAQEGRDEKGKFTLGHLWSLGNKGGAPPLYTSHEEIHDKITEYLQWEEKASKGKYTISGLALFLGFASRQSIEDYKNRDAKFSYVIERFKLFMVHYHEQRLTWAGSFQGSFVWLKNFGNYKDENIVNQNITEFKTKWAEPENNKPQ